MKRLARLVTVLAAANFVCGCTDLNATQRSWLADGQRAYDQQRYTESIRSLSQFIDAVPNRPETAQAFYVRAMANAKVGQRTTAYADLGRCAALPADAETRWRAQVVLGTLHFEEGHWALARQAYAAALEAIPPTAPRDVVLHRLALCQERLGQWPEARATFTTLVNQYPRSSYVQTARRHLAANASCFSAQCGVFSAQKNADALVSTLNSKGVSAFIRRDSRNGKPVFVVLVATYRDYAEAQRGLSMVQAYVPEAVLWPN